MVAMSRQSGQIRRFEEESILALLDLEEYFVREIMVPRTQIVSISVEANLDKF